jgi:homoserine dehydrogenase
VNLALLGFGNVARAFARLLLRKQETLLNDYGLELRVTGIATHSHGIAIDSSGIDLEAALAADMLDALHTGDPVEDSKAFLAACPAQFVIETTWLDPRTGQPATDYVRRALQLGRHVVTANKGPVAFAYRELKSLAAQKDLAFFFESTVMDGGPVLSTLREGLPATDITRIRGVLNSTTNALLCDMEGGTTFAESLRRLQELGIAEADPSNDVDGWDSTVKIVVLANVGMNADLRPQDVDRTGIGQVTPDRVRAAQEAGKRLKLICEAWREDGEVKAKVAPVEVPREDPLSIVEGTSGVVTFHADTLPALTLIESDPTPDTTAYGLLADIINAARGRRWSMVRRRF